MKKLSAMIRDTIKRTGVTQVELQRATGVSQSSLSVFLSGGGINSASLDKIVDAMGARLECMEVKKTANRIRRKRAS